MVFPIIWAVVHILILYGIWWIFKLLGLETDLTQVLIVCAFIEIYRLKGEMNLI